MSIPCLLSLASASYLNASRSPPGLRNASFLVPFSAQSTKSGPITSPKTGCERRRRPREPPGPIRTQLSQPSGLHFGTKIQQIGEKVTKKPVLWRGHFFSRLLGRPGRSTAGANMQSVHAGVVETHFSVFGVCPKKPPKRAPLSSSLETFWHQFRIKLRFLRVPKKVKKKGTPM